MMQVFTYSDSITFSNDKLEKQAMDNQRIDFG